MAFPPHAGSVGSATVPVNDPIYRLLDNLAARGIVPVNLTTIQPLSRIEVGRMLVLASMQSDEIDDRTVRSDLDYYIREFSWDIDRIKETESLFDTVKRVLKEALLDVEEDKSNLHWHMTAYCGDNFQFIFDPLIWTEYNFSDHESDVMRRATGIQFRGNFEGWLGYYFRFIDHVERGNDPYDNRDRLINDRYGYVGPLNSAQKETYCDLTEVYLNSSWKGIDLMFGKDRVAWGCSGDGGLLLSGVAPSFNQLRVSARLTKQLRFTYLVGQLHPSGDVPSDTLYITDMGWTRKNLTPKWLAAHRLEYSPWKPLSIGISEAIIWGERGLDMAYLNPLYFLYSAEHDGGDQDNVLMAGDIRIRVAHHALLYGELLIDDIKTSTIGEGDAGNKIGMTVGGRLYRTGFDGLELGTEYTRLEPYVYSHFYPINRYTTWTTSLGSDIPPNSDRIRWTVRYRPIRQVELMVRIDQNRHGTVGGDPNQTVPRGQLNIAEFLGGDRSDWTTIDVRIRTELKPGLKLEVGMIDNDLYSIRPDRIFASIGYRYFGLDQ